MALADLNTPAVQKIPLDQRKEIWLKIWAALVTTDGLSSPIFISEWADECLAHYAERFYATDEGVQNLFEEIDEAKNV
jgi:hypothetical protein